MAEKHSLKKTLCKPEVICRHLSVVLGTFLVIFIGFMAGCGGSGSSPSSDDPLDDPLPPIEDALWVGIQGGGNGDWQEFFSVSTIDELNALGVQQATTGGVTFRLEDFSMDISDSGSDGKYAIAFVMASADTQEVTSFIFLTTIAELSSIDFSSLLSEENATLQTSMGATASDYYVSMFFSNEDSLDNAWTPSYGPDFDFDAAAGTYDLAAIRTAQSDSTAYLLLFREESLNADEITTIGPIAESDFTDSGYLLSDYTVTITTDFEFDGEMSLVTTNGTEVLLGEGDGDGSASASTLYFAANDAALAGDDMYMLHLNMDIDDDSFISYYRAFAGAGNKSVTPPSESFEGYFSSTISNSSDSLLPGLTGTPPGADVIGYTTQYQGNADGVDYGFSMHVSSGRAGEYINLSTISFHSPDIESTEGWNSRWSIPGTAAMDRSIVSVQLGDTDLSILANWYYTDHPGFLNESWFASIYNVESEEEGGGNL